MNKWLEEAADKADAYLRSIPPSHLSPAARLLVIPLIQKLDVKHFPRICCGEKYFNSRRFMEHFLPVHMVGK